MTDERKEPSEEEFRRVSTMTHAWVRVRVTQDIQTLGLVNNWSSSRKPTGKNGRIDHYNKLVYNHNPISDL